MLNRNTWLALLLVGLAGACDNGDDDDTGIEIEDADGDGVGDLDDNCPDVANEGQENADGDTFGDACDNCPDVDNEDQANADADTFGDACDNCPDVDNEDQANTDADTVGDACDNCPDVDNEDQANADTDIVGDACDNCPDVDNEDQANADTDTFGDACDNCPDVDNEEQEDSEADTVGDACDNCPDVDNEDQAESDGDLFGDACDALVDLVVYEKDTTASHTEPTNQDCFGTAEGSDACVFRGTSGPLEHPPSIQFAQELHGVTATWMNYEELDGLWGPFPLYQNISIEADLDSGVTQWNAMVTTWQNGQVQEDGSFSSDASSEKGFGWTRAAVTTFTKEDLADTSLPENQDCFAPNVCLTRGDTKSLFNIAQEESHTSSSPAGTEWAGVSTRMALASGAAYGPFSDAVESNPKSAIGRILSMHIPGTDLYYDVVITSWSGGGPGGGFAWSRSRALVPGCTDASASNYNAAATVSHGFCGDEYTEFYKMPGADWTTSDAQDCLSDELCLTRGENYFIFNPLSQEPESSSLASPDGTAWFNTTTEWALENDATYADFSATVQWHGFWLGRTVSLLDVANGTYHDIHLLGWQSGNSAHPEGTGSVYWVRKEVSE